MSGWLVKWRQSSKESVLAHWDSEEAAERDAFLLNQRYQTDEYYVEAYDPAKAWKGVGS